MPSRWKKLAYSLVSVLVGSALFTGLSLLLPGKSEGLLATFAVATTLIFAVSLVGWLIAVPLVLVINNIAGWRFWLYLGIGSSIGPIVAYRWIVSPFLRSYTGHYSQIPTVMGVLGISLVISGSASAMYLLLLRRAQIRGGLRSQVTGL